MKDKPPTPAALLRRLHARGHSDAHIASELSLAFSPRFWSKRQVWTLRTKLGLSANRPHGEGGALVKGKVVYQSLLELRRASWRQQLRKAGWAHLLALGLDLRPRETRILCLLRERGPQTRRQLAVALGGRLEGHGHDSLRALRAAGLAVAAGQCRDARSGRPATRWRLSATSLPRPPAPRPKTGVERARPARRFVHPSADGYNGQGGIQPCS